MYMTIVTQTLYRKYRPQTFDDVIGQSEVVDTLRNQIASGSIAHAYLFSGGRGTGKTSIARIFARELGTDDTDIYEIDAASNRGINEIRELREGVSNRPFKSQYKVYIIDEVHMLTKEAFNALLKTLEEPPAHVIFILATTEKHKVLDTILSRCQVYDFRLAIEESLVELVHKVADSEGRTMDEDSVRYVAKLGNGSFRDTLSHLQKVFAVCEGDISRDAIRDVLGNSGADSRHKLLRALSDKDGEAMMAAYGDMTISTDVINELLEDVRTAMMLRNSASYRTQAASTLSEDTVDFYSNLSGVTSHTLRDLLEVKTLMLASGNPQESFEVFLHEQVEKWEQC